jgi:hypothetical protein
MNVANEKITKGFIVAGLMNASVLIFSRLFTNPTIATHEFIRRFMLHLLPSGFHSIRHYGLLASPTKLKHARRLLNMAEPEPTVETHKKDDEPASFECRTCHSPLYIMAIRKPFYLPRAPPSTKDKK